MTSKERKARTISIGKFEEGIINEDAVIAQNKMIAVSDGAGGGGVFADLWSHYLLNHLPNQPISSFEKFDDWIDNIWENFYDNQEIDAKSKGGMFLNKFYEEGSFATLVSVWKIDDNTCQWISYGDSVAFCYHPTTRKLFHSFSELKDFDNPPYLINCKDPLQEKGFKCGKFSIEKDSIVFVASDTLSHYIIMMYEIAKKNLYSEELQAAIDSKTKNSNYIKYAISMKDVDFESVLKKLYNSAYREFLFKSHISSLIRKGLIGFDDYSIAFMNTNITRLF